MATSDRIQGVSTVSSAYTLRADWFRVSVNILTNTERVGVNCYVFRNDGSATGAYTSNANEMKTTLTVNGTVKTFQTVFDTRNSKIANVGYFEFDIEHNSDGTKTAALEFKFYCAVGSILDGTSMISGSMSLDTIPREVTFVSTPNFNIGSSAIITVSNPGNLYANLTIKNGSTELVSTEGVLNGKISLDILSSVLYPLTPNSNTLTLTAELITYTSFGGTQVGITQTATINAIVTNSNPTIGSVVDIMHNLYWVNTPVSGGYSYAEITINDVVAQNSATIVKITGKCSSYSDDVTSPVSGDDWFITLLSIESNTYYIVAKDSRGNSTTYTGTFSGVYRYYKKPYVDSITLIRDQLINAETLLNCVLKIDTTPNVTKAVSAAGDNEARAVSYSYKETTSSTWTTVNIYKNIEYYGDKDYIEAPPEMVISGDTVTITNLQLSFDTTKQYDFMINISDWLDSGSEQIVLDSASPTRCEKMTATGSVTGFNMVPTINGAGGVQSRYGIFNWSGGRLIGNMYGVCSTAAATTEKTVAIDGFELVTGALATVQFTYAVPASATLNINGTGAKAIRCRGSAIVNGVISAGSTCEIVYNGTYYDILSADQAGYVVESGAENGWVYRKWANGLYECWNIVTYTTTITVAWGSGYISSSTNIAFPRTFSSIPNIQLSVSCDESDGALGIIGAPTTSNTGNIWLFRATPRNPAATYRLHFYVVTSL